MKSVMSYGIFIPVKKIVGKAEAVENRGYSDEKIDGIFESQLTEEEYRRHCVKVIDNNGSVEDTNLQLVKRFLNEEK